MHQVTCQVVYSAKLHCFGNLMHPLPAPAGVSTGVKKCKVSDANRTE